MAGANETGIHGERGRGAKGVDDMLAGERTRDRTIENPVEGARLTFVQTTRETGGECLAARVEVAPHAPGTLLHCHMGFTEAFRVLEGRVNMQLGDRQMVLGPGDTAFAGMGDPHRWYNDSDEPAAFLVEVRPAKRCEDALRIFYGLASDGQVDARGNLRPWHLAYLSTLAEAYPPGAPRWLARPALAVLGAITRWRGVDKELARYL